MECDRDRWGTLMTNSRYVGIGEREDNDSDICIMIMSNAQQ